MTPPPSTRAQTFLSVVARAARAREPGPRPTMLYSIILPTYNERENLPIIVHLLLHRGFADGSLAFEAVIADDASPDETLRRGIA